VFGRSLRGLVERAPTLLSPGSEFQAGGNPPLAGEPTAKPIQKKAKKKKPKGRASKGKGRSKRGKAKKAAVGGRASRKGGRS